MDLNTYVLARAMQNNICTPWAEKISHARSVDDLLKMYVAGIDFCLEHDFPSNADLVTLGGDHINQYGIYVDQTIKLTDRPFIVLLGRSSGTVKYSGFNTAQIFLKHNSSSNILVQGNASVIIDCFDDSVLNIEVSDYATAFLNVYVGAQVNYKSSGKGVVKIINKLTKTYDNGEG